MATVSRYSTDIDIDVDDIQKLYEYEHILNESKDKSQKVKEYVGIIRGSKGSVKARQLAAQLIPRFFKDFSSLWDEASTAQFDLCEDVELGVRVQAIRGLQLFCKDKPEFVPKIVEFMGQLLTAAGENVERDTVHKALMSLLWMDAKASLTALFKLFGSIDESVRQKVLCFVKEKVFPLKEELFKPPEEMERHITDLVKQCLKDLTKEEFNMFLAFLTNLSLYGQHAPAERLQVLVDLIEEYTLLQTQLDVSGSNHIDRFLHYLCMTLPFCMRGASNGKLLNYMSKHILPVLDKFPEEQKLDLLKNLAESSPSTTPEVSRQLLPYVVLLLKKHMPQRKTEEEIKFTCIECLLYTFHRLAHKTPNTTNSLCGYNIVTGQPSDRIGEDFSGKFRDFMERLRTIEGLARATVKKSTRDVVEHNEVEAVAKSNELKSIIIERKQKIISRLRTCNNILVMIQPLRSKSPSFIGDQKINLSWKAGKISAPSTAAAFGGKRTATLMNGSSVNTFKKGRVTGGRMQNFTGSRVNSVEKGRVMGDGARSQLIAKALDGLSNDRGTVRRGQWWSRRGRGRGRGRGCC